MPKSSKLGTASQEFSKEILFFKDIFEVDDAELAGMLLGAGSTFAARAGITKGNIITVVSRTFDEAIEEGLTDVTDKGK